MHVLTVKLHIFVPGSALVFIPTVLLFMSRLLFLSSVSPRLRLSVSAWNSSITSYAHRLSCKLHEELFHTFQLIPQHMTQSFMSILERSVSIFYLCLCLYCVYLCPCFGSFHRVSDFDSHSVLHVHVSLRLCQWSLSVPLFTYDCVWTYCLSVTFSLKNNTIGQTFVLPTLYILDRDANGNL